MGIYGALATAVTGLQAQSFALEHISGNIANSQTTGYKRIETDFVDLIPDAPSNRQIAGAVLAQSRATNDVQGDITVADRNTYMAINGGGFFVVEQKIGVNDGNAVFGGTDFYTRRGDFDVDKEGYLVNGSNAYLKGLPIDSKTGNVAGSVPEVIQLDNAFLPSQRTAIFNYQLNLPQLPKNAAYDPVNANSELIVPASYTGGTIATIAADDNALFLSNSIAGGAITVYAENGAPANVQLRWAKTDSYANGGTDKWNLFYQSDADATGANAQWTNVGTTYDFATNGSLAPAIPSVSLTGLTIDGITIGDVSLQHGSNGVTQFSDANGTTEVTKLSQNGYPAGEFVSVEVNREGRIVANYNNGKKVELAQVVTAQFNSENSLRRHDGGIYSATSESGDAILDIDGNVTGAALESSNTDISEEFTKLIVTQQAYAAGTRIVKSADEMLQEALNMVR
ncbi:flagellar hook protein FlgE [Maritalea sp.]|uniref:flagellar hook protein FlgE n=1 Tax=Maritalea sp. TaxID=2003361 RepID=UPI003EF0BA62